MATAATPKPAAPAAPTTATAVAGNSTNALRAYQLETTDPDSGEVTTASRFRYIPGHPRQVRFDAKKGEFNLNGERVLGPTLTFIPVALRVFEDDILKMGRKTWAELFFVDDSGALCAVLFHGYSVGNLQKLNSALYYDDLPLTSVLLTATAARKENKQGKGSFFIAEFSYTDAPADEVLARQQFAQDHPIWREETTTSTADTRLVCSYRLPAGREPQAAPRPAHIAEPNPA